MANFNYTHRLRGANAACLMSETCSWCYRDGKRNSFFGVPMTGGTIMGHRPQDRDFQKTIWIAAREHYREVHGREIVRNGAGGWKVQKI